VIETLTTGPMIPLGTNSSPVAREIDSVMETLTTGPMILSYFCWWTISIRGYHPPSSQCYYHWVDTSAGGLLVPEGIIGPVVSESITGSIALATDDTLGI
jgi:hypothetical protein